MKLETITHIRLGIIIIIITKIITIALVPYPFGGGEHLEPYNYFDTFQYNNKPDTEQNINDKIEKKTEKSNDKKTNQPKKEGLSTVSKVLIGLGVVAAGILAVKCGKTPKVSQTKKLFENIKFKPAETVDDAIAFGKNHLGIKNYEGFAKADKDVLNWANEACVNIKNVTKGKVQPFDSIISTELPDGVFAAAYNDCNTQLGRVLGINSKAKQLIDKTLQNANMTGVNVSSETAQTVMKNLNRYKQAPESFTFGDKVQLYEDLKCLIHSNGTQVGNRFSSIFHEVGHFEHQLAVGKDRYLQMGKPKECIQNLGKVSDTTTKFLNNSQTQNIAGMVSEYARESPLEFVAETFDKLMQEQKLSDEVMTLYGKYGGPPII